MFVIRTVPLKDLWLAERTHHGVDLDKVLKYAALPRETAPPIDARTRDDHYEVDNGHHRYAAALIRGDKEVLISFWED